MGSPARVTVNSEIPQVTRLETGWFINELVKFTAEIPREFSFHRFIQSCLAKPVRFFMEFLLRLTLSKVLLTQLHATEEPAWRELEDDEQYERDE